MVFEYRDSIPAHLSQGHGEVGESIAFPARFRETVAPTFHKKGYSAGPEFLGMQFSMSLLQYWVMRESGVLIGEGGSFQHRFNPGRIDGYFTNFPQDSSTFYGRKLENPTELQKFVSPFHQRNLPPDSPLTTGVRVKYHFLEDKVQSTMGHFAPILERMRTCELLHQLGAEYMLLRALTERGHDGQSTGNTKLLAGLSEQQQFIYTTLLEERGGKIKTLLYNLVNFYISEAKAYCDGKLVQAISQSHPPSEFVVCRFKEAFKKKFAKEPTDSDWQAFVTAGDDDGWCTLEDVDDGDPLVLFVPKEKFQSMSSHSFDETEMFNPNALPLPQELLAAIDDIYRNGVASIPTVNLATLHQFRVEMIPADSENTFDAKSMRQAILDRFKISDEMLGMFPGIYEELELQAPASSQPDTQNEVADTAGATNHLDTPPAKERQYEPLTDDELSLGNQMPPKPSPMQQLGFFGSIGHTLRKLFNSPREEDEHDDTTGYRP